MELEDALLYGMAGVLAVPIVFSLLRRVEPPPAKYALTIEATEGGTTDPSPGTYTYTEEIDLTATAIPNVGYLFKGWFLNGELASTDVSFTFRVTGQHLLIASFEEEGAPPLIPAYIKPIQNRVSEEWWNVREEYHDYNSPLWIEHDIFKVGFVKFKICDAAGNGVPDQMIAVYSDPQPDITDYGFVQIGYEVHTIDNPKILVSDGDGVVSVPIRYQWLELDSDYKETIGMGGKARFTCFPIPGDRWHYPLYNGIRPGFNCVWREFVRMRHPLYRTLNSIHAYWVDNPNLPVWGDCIADCMIKICGSKTFG